MTTSPFILLTLCIVLVWGKSVTRDTLLEDVVDLKGDMFALEDGDELQEMNVDKTDDFSGKNGIELNKIDKRTRNVLQQDSTRCGHGLQHSISTERQCGERCCQPQKDKRIWDGVNAQEGEFPWHATLFKLRNYRWRLFCGGVLVGSRHILTAAHCIADRHFCKDEDSNGKRYCPEEWYCDEHYLRGKYRIAIGKLDISLRNDGTTDLSDDLYEAEAVIFHNNFAYYPEGGRIIQNDVALIRLTRDAHNPYACIYPDPTIHFEKGRDGIHGQGCYGIGHGDTKIGHGRNIEGSSILQKVPVFFHNESWCRSIFNAPRDIDLFQRRNFHFYHNCATSRSHGRLIACYMDSGSPIMCPEKPGDVCSPYYVAGIFSFMKLPDCRDNSESLIVNTRSHSDELDYYSPHQWINESMERAGCDN